MKRKLALLALPGLGLFCLPNIAGDAGGAAHMRFDRHKGYDEIVVRFDNPVELRSHSPVARGRHLQIDFRVIRQTGGVALAPRVLDWRDDPDAQHNDVYDAVRLEAEQDYTSLLIDFTQEYDFIVFRGSDARTLVVSVMQKKPATTTQDGDGAKPTTAGGGGPTQPVPAAPVAAVPATDTVRGPDANARRDRATSADLLAEARAALGAGNLDRAIALLTNVLERPESAETPVALEYLGIARERKQQLAHATAVYRDYLARYPDRGEDTARIRQRLQALVSVERLGRAASEGPAKDGIAARRAADDSAWRVFGSFTNYYRYADLSLNRSGSKYFFESDSYVAQSDVLSQLNYTARRRGEAWDVEASVAGGYLYNFLGEEHLSARHGNDVLMAEASVEFSRREDDATFAFGRQYHSGDGVLGRFDGVLAAYPLSKRWRVNVIGGRPVDLVRDTSVDESQRYFVAGSVDFTPDESRWQYTAFAATQRVDGIEDRRAVGGEVRYASAASTLFATADYDLGYGDLNTLLVIGNLTTDGGTTYSATVDYRKSPLLVTRNALIGQLADSIDELKDVFSNHMIRKLAADRTADSHYVMASVLHPFGNDLQLYASVAEFEFGSTQASGGVEGYPGTGAEYGYETQLIARNVLRENDSHIVSLRYYDGQTVDRTGLGLNSRFVWGQKWRVQPRVWLEYRDNGSDDTHQWGLRPSLRLIYTPARHHYLELEVGRDWSLRDVALYGDEEMNSNYLLLSYRLDFD